MKFTDEELEKRYAVISPEIREVLSSPEIATRVGDVAQKNNLLESEAEELERQITYVLLGLASSKNFTETLYEEIPVTKPEVDAIVKELEEILFSKYKKFITPEKTEPIPTSQTILTEIEDKEEKPKAGVEVPHTTGILVRKLENVSTLPKQESVSTPPSAKPGTPPRSVDPYREPVN